MSYYTKVELLLPEKIATRPGGVEAVLDELGLHHDALADLDKLFAKRKCTAKMNPAHVDAIMTWVSKQRPGVRYVVRALGEDDEGWTREYRDGESKVSDYRRPAASSAASKTARAAIAAIVDATPYTPNARYEVGQAIEHPSFGKGIVAQAQPTKIVVQFNDAERTLVHARGG